MRVPVATEVERVASDQSAALVEGCERDFQSTIEISSRKTMTDVAARQEDHDGSVFDTCRMHKQGTTEQLRIATHAEAMIATPMLSRLHVASVARSCGEGTHSM